MISYLFLICLPFAIQSGCLGDIRLELIKLKCKGISKFQLNGETFYSPEVSHDFLIQQSLFDDQMEPSFTFTKHYQSSSQLVSLSPKLKKRGLKSCFTHVVFQFIDWHPVNESLWKLGPIPSELSPSVMSTFSCRASSAKLKRFHSRSVTCTPIT